MYSDPKEAFVTLKDTKPNFINDPKCRLINPTKFEIAKISKKILTRVVDELKVKTKLQLWKNTDAVIDWFENLQNKKDLRFVSFDIKDYYSEISRDTFEKAMEWARGMVEISDDEMEVIFRQFPLL